MSAGALAPHWQTTRQAQLAVRSHLKHAQVGSLAPRSPAALSAALRPPGCVIPRRRSTLVARSAPGADRAEAPKPCTDE